MKKIIITSSQYNKILLHEQHARLSNNILNENVNEILMGFSKLIKIPLTGLNKIKGESDLKNKDVILKIKNTLEDKNKLKDLVKLLSDKSGNEEIKIKLANNAQTIIDDYNYLATKNGLKDMLGLDALTNLKELV